MLSANLSLKSKMIIFHVACVTATLLTLYLASSSSSQQADPNNDVPAARLTDLMGRSDLTHLKNAVDKILIPRVVGTPGHDKVRDYIVDSMKGHKWHVEFDSFDDDTPNMGRLRFENIIATVNPDAERFLVLACHYDSKYEAEYEFLGATDSAVPCAMLLNLAHALRDYHERIARKSDLSLKFVFFDGEEAFKEWGPDDSIYGARHLAKAWSQSGLIQRLDMLVLLDLIGCPDPRFYSFFKNTHDWHTQLLGIEKRLAAKDYLKNYAGRGLSLSDEESYFQPMSTNALVEDDHIPFLRRGVPVLHLIPMPFPSIWHTRGDTLDVIDYDTVENINKILRVFITEYLDLFQSDEK